MGYTNLKKNNPERPVDALAEKTLMTHSLTDNLKSRDASASKKDSEATRQIRMNKDDLLKID